jgi:hypothetical protein
MLFLNIHTAFMGLVMYLLYKAGEKGSTSHRLLEGCGVRGAPLGSSLC